MVFETDLLIFTGIGASVLDEGLTVGVGVGVGVLVTTLANENEFP
jgi:hypothetical protein